jgi:hypothetical protein
MPKRPDHLRLVDLIEAAEGIVSRLAGTSDIDIEIVYTTAVEPSSVNIQLCRGA